MKIWTVFVGELTHLDGNQRHWRYEMLAEAVRSRGHEVVRWFPSYAHGTRKQREPGLYTVNGDSLNQLRVLATPSYRQHVGIERLWFNRVYANRFLSAASSCSPPDIIIVGMPAPELCDAVRRYSAARNIPYVIDVRDLWPDIFIDAVPPLLRWAGSLALWPFYEMNRSSFAGAAAIYALSDSYLQWGLGYARRERGIGDSVFPMGCDEPKALEPGGFKFWQDHGVSLDSQLCVFAGTMSEQFDIDLVFGGCARDAWGQ